MAKNTILFKNVLLLLKMVGTVLFVIWLLDNLPDIIRYVFKLI